MAEDFMFSKSTDQIYVEWKIKDIFERCRKQCLDVKSPPFSVCCSKWCLMASIKPRYKLSSTFWLDLYLRKEAYSKEHHLACRIGIKKAGVVVKCFNLECRSGSEENTWGMTDFFEFKEAGSDQKPSEATGFDISTKKGKNCSGIEEDRNPWGISFIFPTVGVTNDGSLTVFCNARLQDAITFPSPVSSAIALPVTPVTKKPQDDCAFGNVLLKQILTPRDETFVENIKDLYINKRYSDVTIEVKAKEFLAHKCILAARSAVFASMFNHNMAEKSTGRVEITDCEPDSFEDFLIFLYTGRLNVVSSTNATSLYKTADKYNIEELMEECVRCMIRELSVDSFCDALHFATVYNETDLLTAARNFFNDNVTTILPTLKWHKFLEEHPSVGNELFIGSLASKEKSDDS